LDELHEWALVNDKGIKMLLQYLWPAASPEQQTKTLALLSKYLKIKFEKYYIASEGSFSYYPNAEHATLDGTSGVLGLLRHIGSFSAQKQRKFLDVSVQERPRVQVLTQAAITAQDLAAMSSCPEVNSVRWYAPAPDSASYLSHLVWIVYPKESVYLDAMDLLARVNHWLESTLQTTGNWVSREVLLQAEELKLLPAGDFWKQELRLEEATELLKKHKQVVVIGFDLLQLPRYQIIFNYKVR
jgi:hypothetical protein